MRYFSAIAADVKRDSDAMREASLQQGLQTFKHAISRAASVLQDHQTEILAVAAATRHQGHQATRRQNPEKGPTEGHQTRTRFITNKSRPATLHQVQITKADIAPQLIREGKTTRRGRGTAGRQNTGERGNRSRQPARRDQHQQDNQIAWK